MYYSYVEIEYVAMSFSPTRTDLAVKLLISKAIRPLDWIQTHPKSVPSSFLGASILQQELTIETAGSLDNHIVGANGIPRRGMSSP
jgi:hypothetical protein